jgi:hypothetical protein
MDRTETRPWALSEHGTGSHNRANAANLGILLDGFSKISLEELSAMALLNRIDTKYVMTLEQLLSIMPALREDYRVLEVEGQRLNHYRTLYFDTPDFDLFTMHVNGMADRYKVRSREYLDSHLSFLEVKHKTRKDRTIKQRICTEKVVDHMTDDAEDWLEDVYPYDSHELEPKVWNTFTRVTLAGRSNCERVTLDFNLTFSSNFRIIRLDRLAIAEVKLDGRGCASPFTDLMRQMRVHPQGFSKYCIGTSMLFEHVKKNAMKAQLLQIQKISNGV